MVFMLCTSTATYLPRSDNATTASTVDVVGDDHPVGLQPRARAGPGGRHQDAQLLAFLQAAVAAAGTEQAAIDLASSGVAPWSRRIDWTVSLFFTT